MSEIALHDRPGTAAADFGDVNAEFDGLRSACGVYDLGQRAKIALTGSDRVRWLNGMVTNSIRDLQAGHRVYAFLLNPQGRILADLYAWNRGEFLEVETDRSQVEKLLATFDHYIISDDVEVADQSDKLIAIGVAGPDARKILEKASLAPGDLGPLQFVDLMWQGGAVTVARGDNPAVASYEFWLEPEKYTPLWDALVAAGAKPAGTSALELLRVASGIPKYGQDIRERDLPQETEQIRALNFNKGCYVGQEIVERIRSRGNVHRMFTGFLVDGPLPVAGTKIQVDGKDVGEVTSAASLPTSSGQRPVALGYIRREFAGKELVAGASKVTVHKLPFTELLEH